METKLTESISFHPQIDGKTKVANKMIVHIPRMYNSKHPCTWDESLPYFHHSYNQAIHISIGHNHFKVCLGFQLTQLFPLHPYRNNLPILKLRLIRKPYLLKGFTKSSNNSMTSCRNSMPSTHNDMTNTKFHTSF
jgi:hypothetical protein